MAAAIGEGEQIRHVARSKDLGLFAEHVTHPNSTTSYKLI
jgi:hypothetical protein